MTALGICARRSTKEEVNRAYDVLVHIIEFLIIKAARVNTIIVAQILSDYLCANCFDTLKCD